MNGRVTFAILAASMGWGLAGVGTRAVFEDGVSTFSVLAVRTLVATAAVVAFVVGRQRGIDPKAWRHGALIGIPRIAIAPAFFIGSLNFVSAGFEAIVITLIPVVTAAMAHLVLGERLRATQTLGLALGLVGTVVLVTAGESGIADGSGDTVVGGTLALGGVLFGSLSGILSRRFAPRHDTAELALPMFVSGAVTVVILGALLQDIDLGPVTARSWLLLLLLGLGSTLLPFAATLYASRHTTAARVALTGYLAPLIGVVGGIVLLGEVLTVSIFVGGSLAIAGVALAGLGSRQAVDLVE